MDEPVKMERPTKKVLFRESSIEIRATPSTPDVSDSECEDSLEESGPTYATIKHFKKDHDDKEVADILVPQFESATTLSPAVQLKGIDILPFIGNSANLLLL